MNKEEKERTLIQEFKYFVDQILLSDKIFQEKDYIQHGCTSCYLHSLAVAYYSFKFAKQFNLSCDYKGLVRGALLHDYFLYDWHEKCGGHRFHGFSHPYKALDNALLEYQLNNIEKNIILRHMFPLTPIPPKYIESVIVCITDKVCSFNETFKIKEYSKIAEISIKVK